MRNYGLYDVTRGLATGLAAGLAGVLVWLATLVGVQSVTRFWESMGLVAAAGLVVALSQVIGGWTKGHGVRVSPGTFLLAFVPVLVCVGWILMATQPGNGWHEGTITRWSHSLGIYGLVHSLGLWHGVLAFGFGLMLGMTFDTVPAPAVEPVPAPAPGARRRLAEDDTVDEDETYAADRRGPRWRRRPRTAEDADEPVTAERQAVTDRRPHTVTVGPRTQAARDDVGDVEE
jgi:hypothetical protein